MTKKLKLEKGGNCYALQLAAAPVVQGFNYDALIHVL